MARAKYCILVSQGNLIRHELFHSCFYMARELILVSPTFPQSIFTGEEQKQEEKEAD